MFNNEKERKERIAFMAREWRKNNPEKVRQHNQKRYQKNKEKILANDKEYYNKNREYIINRQREYYNVNKEKIKEYQYNLRRERADKTLFRHAKERAKKNGIEFSITIEDIIIPDVCPLLNIPIKVGNGKVCDNSPSIDRINSNLGYTKSNIQILSHKANRIKSNSSFEEFETIYLNWKNQVKE